ncbi:MAG TPA: nuclear transport factor 2 family protein, partial [Pseudonocardiaceae bacterium]|nr:nuclear transport factor 2 family protein [Pseudonocardiaceae bacterium]
TLTEIFAESAVWHEPGSSLIAGDYVGRDRVFEFFGKLAELSGRTFKADPVDILADDDRAVAVQHSTGTRNGKTLDTRDILEFEISDGKVVNVQLYACDIDQENAFWS